MRYSKYLLFLTCGLFSGSALMAQQKIHRDSIIQNQTIQISQVYKPEIAKPEKPVLTPTLPHIDTTRPHFKYVVPQQTLSYTYHSIPIRPLALGKLTEATSFSNYVKAGLGNLSSIYVDAGIGSLKGADYETAFHFTHLSQKGTETNQQSSNTRFDASGNYFLEDHILGAELNIAHSGYSYYGYNPEQYHYSKNDIRQAFTGGRLRLHAANTTANDLNIWYHPELSFSLYGDRYNTAERSFAFDLPAKMTLDSVMSVSLGISGNLSSLKTNDSTQSNNLFQINPALDLSLKNTAIHIGLSPAFGKNNIAYLLPDLNLTSRFFSNTFTLTAGWKGSIVQNTYEQLSNKNPFLYDLYPVRQSKTDQIYLGFKTAVKEHFSFGATLSWKQWQNLALFINDYAENPDGKKFAVVYDKKVQALNFEAYAHYQVGAVFGISARGSWYNFFQTATYDKVWGEPMLRLGGVVEARPLKKLSLNATLDFWDGIYARTITGKADKLPAFLDLGLSGEYNLIPRLSVFLRLNNILNDRYQRWNQYNSYGFNIIGGLRFKF